jgi:hypothetical protein
MHSSLKNCSSRLRWVYMVSCSYFETSGMQCPGRCVSSASLYSARLLARRYFIKVKDIPS